jgi:hypothetical protein
VNGKPKINVKNVKEVEFVNTKKKRQCKECKGDSLCEHKNIFCKIAEVVHL